MQDLAENIYTVRQAIDEIRDRQTRARLEVLPYELKILEPTEESIAAGIDVMLVKLTRKVIYFTNFVVGFQ